MDVDERYLSVDQLRETRNKIMLFILNNVQSKIPMRQTDFTELSGKNASIFKESFNRVREALDTLYGILLKEVTDSKSGKKWICVSDLPACSSAEYDKQQSRELSLAFLIVSYIFMCDAPVEEVQLENFLAALGIGFNDSHAYFGENVKKLVTETFVRQLYLKREKSHSENNKETVYVYSLGFRSHVEFNKQQLLETAAKIIGQPSKMFVKQYKKAYLADQNEEENEENYG